MKKGLRLVQDFHGLRHGACITTLMKKGLRQRTALKVILRDACITTLMKKGLRRDVSYDLAPRKRIPRSG